MIFLPSAVSMSIDVTELQVPTTMTLSVSPNPPIEGQDATFTAEVLGPGPGQDTPGPGDGAVEFSVDGVVAGTVQLDAPAVDLGLQLSAGPHTIDARFIPHG